MMIPEIALFIWDVEKKRKWWTKKKKKKNSQKGYQNIIIYSTPNKLCEIFFLFCNTDENFKRKREECFIKFIFFIM